MARFEHFSRYTASAHNSLFKCESGKRKLVCNPSFTFVRFLIVIVTVVEQSFVSVISFPEVVLSFVAKSTNMK